MRAHASARRAEVVLGFHLYVGFYESFLLILLIIVFDGVWVAAASIDLQTRVFPPEWVNEEANVTKNEQGGCDGQVTERYIWKNVGWGSNTNSEFHTARPTTDTATTMLFCRIILCS